MVAAVLALAVVGASLRVMRRDPEQPAVWDMAALVLGPASAGPGTPSPCRCRRAALLLAGLVLLALNALAILPIGFRILVAGHLACSLP